ncbi:Endonuclease/Exonuclease/phosphatase family protein [Roseovarius nanhaiticus]|uniref:Endonuclease/Exonuclease/phosphatase family protein n=1 Tax=Roseovarius nanhaiticus TaxID=573024 RepID=A0A1N7EEU3_9RHOB|nr:endonuclease/exonuclease/phosphatase family protein [Roseovarius nanhaiticus]SEK76162.1 Endonuclease/Exonuclease/phosphatase family protein [Roseovarius nanhaiticus]SIR86564.1 Endonuclease/Exonuclease/phosphatase family protein [Roseovarius nanhaiticus]
MASYNTDLSRDGPGLLLRDILRGDDQAEAVAQVIADLGADILLLQNVDFDLDHLALAALRDLIAARGLDYPTVFALRPNTGVGTGLDLDRDGRLGEPEDAQGHGAFAGQGGMALLSRWPIDLAGVKDLSGILWRDLPGALLPQMDGVSYFAPEVLDVLRLADVAHWVVPVQAPDGPVTILAFHASPPVFDGSEDRNGRRNHDQLTFWRHYLDGAFGPAVQARFVLVGHANQDPQRGEGIEAGIRGLLSDPRLQDVRPRRPGGTPREATVDWPRVTPSMQRVGYVLPSRDMTVLDAGVAWPQEGPRADVAAAASRHRPVWVNLALP